MGDSRAVVSRLGRVSKLQLTINQLYKQEMENTPSWGRITTIEFKVYFLFQEALEILNTIMQRSNLG